MLGTIIPKEQRKEVYLDHAAATPMAEEVIDAMQPYFTQHYGNPGGLYRKGREAMQAISAARAKVAKLFCTQPEQILFVGSGTESDNLAIFGIARAYSAQGKHIVSSAIEHHAVLHPLKQLKKEGYEINNAVVGVDGQITPEAVIEQLREDTILVSVMYANNEIGTINPIAGIGRAILKWKKEHGRKPTDAPFFHTDACQASGALELSVEKLHVDLMTINGSKIYGPKGVGVLYARRGVRLQKMIYGGTQEFRKRAGTGNVASIVGLATALEFMQQHKTSENTRLIGLRDWFTTEVLKRIPKTVLNGHAIDRLPNNINISFLDIEGEALILYLDEYGISVSTGSACTSETLDPSHVIVGIGKPYEYAHSSMRFTLGKDTTQEDLEYVLTVLEPTVKFLRTISPVNVSMEADSKDVTLQSAFVDDGVPHFVKKQQRNT